MAALGGGIRMGALARSLLVVAVALAAMAMLGMAEMGEMRSQILQTGATAAMAAMVALVAAAVPVGLAAVGEPVKRAKRETVGLAVGTVPLAMAVGAADLAVVFLCDRGVWF